MRNMLSRSQCLKMLIYMLLLVSGGSQVQSYGSKDNIFADVLLTDLLNRMDNDMQVGYYDVDNDGDMAAVAPKDNVDLVSRSEYSRLCEGGSDCVLQSAVNANPSLRDHEFLQHSSLWGHQFISGGMGEGPNRFNNIVKNDAGLPAYCNPPNPCPEGYDADTQGGSCLMDFENTAIFSREFQAAQDCTCDNEHMFDCSEQDSADSGSDKGDLNSAVEQYILQMGQENSLNNVNSLVKKAGYPAMPDPRMDAVMNPFLQGDRLPIAAKKGNMLFH
ncbi:neuroendocrine protein 7B2 [Drosophila guanche]|uniref:Neuroendocrine protein 7B2 n=1 Tax=Drosophila guanche TaxID=7266 RepID=A0A3B0KF04_DROGU|nr:neuroendocrine protein 7B2 [Drosophila guanche]SPP83631.1 blast:Neuroendocrine protein 7B2 [Drosophila guanche]